MGTCEKDSDCCGTGMVCRSFCVICKSADNSTTLNLPESNKYCAAPSSPTITSSPAIIKEEGGAGNNSLRDTTNSSNSNNNNNNRGQFGPPPVSADPSKGGSGRGIDGSPGTMPNTKPTQVGGNSNSGTAS